MASLIGWLEHTLEESIMSRLLDYIETAKKVPFSVNHDLVGNIHKSLALEDIDNWFFNDTLYPLIQKYIEIYPVYAENLNTLTADVPYCLDQFWVNFQKEHDFNPLHNHSGIFSFVIWVKIPTDWREQHALPISANSRSPKASNFEFVYINLLGSLEMHPYLLDKEMEGHMLFFPAKLNHMVHPFYNCSEERISISGNIKLDTRESTFIKNSHKIIEKKYNDITKIMH